MSLSKLLHIAIVLLIFPQIYFQSEQRRSCEYIGTCAELCVFLTIYLASTYYVLNEQPGSSRPRWGFEPPGHSRDPRCFLRPPGESSADSPLALPPLSPVASPSPQVGSPLLPRPSHPLDGCCSSYCSRGPTLAVYSASHSHSYIKMFSENKNCSCNLQNFKIGMDARCFRFPPTVNCVFARELSVNT